LLKAFERTLKSVPFILLRPLFGKGDQNPPADFRPSRILVIRQHNQLGDMLCVVPLLRALRARYGKASIALMTSPVNHEVMLHNRYLNRIIDYDKRMFLGTWGLKLGPLFRYLRALRDERYDLVLVPSTVSFSATSSLLAFLSGAPQRIGVGSIDGLENTSALFLTMRLRIDWTTEPHRHQTLRNLDVASPLGLSSSDLHCELTLTEGERSDALRFLRENSTGTPRILFHPGAGKRPNRWPPERFANVANVLGSGRNAEIFVTQGPMDEEPVGEMARQLNVRFTLIAGRPIREVAAILSYMDLVISNDTGVMHVAAAVGVPVLSLFGPTDPLQWAPVGEKHRFLHRGDDIRTISVEDVVGNAREMLGQSGRSKQ
jgi:heptosyltransferase-2